VIINSTDGIAIASKLTPKRVLNAWNIWRSFHSSQKNGIANIKGLPISIAIEPTTACNLRCPECPSGLRSFTRPTGKLSSGFFKKTIDELSDHLAYLTFYFQGEPYLNPEFLEMVHYASKQKIYTTTSTNAHFLDEENARKTVESGLNRLIISIDGATQGTYEAYRKEGDLEKVLEGTSNAVHWKKKLLRNDLQILWQFLVVRPNEHEIGQIKKMAKAYQVDKVAFKTAQIYDFENGNELIPTIDQYSRYKKVSDSSYKIKNELENKCWKMWHSCVITWDGQVIPCCFDKDAKHSLGDLKSTSFKEIWHSDKYNQFRNALLNSRSSIDICQNCTEGLKVWA